MIGTIVFRSVCALGAGISIGLVGALLFAESAPALIIADTLIRMKLGG